MPDDDPCKQEPCKSAIDKFDDEVRRGREFEARIRVECRKLKAMRSLFMRVGFLWAALLAAAIICLALILPEFFCQPILIAFTVISALLAFILTALVRQEFFVTNLSRGCRDLEWAIFLAREEVRKQCPPRCVPDIVYLNCDCE